MQPTTGPLYTMENVTDPAGTGIVTHAQMMEHTTRHVRVHHCLKAAAAFIIIGEGGSLHAIAQYDGPQLMSYNQSGYRSCSSHRW